MIYSATWTLSYRTKDQASISIHFVLNNHNKGDIKKTSSHQNVLLETSYIWLQFDGEMQRNEIKYMNEYLQYVSIRIDLTIKTVWCKMTTREEDI